VEVETIDSCLRESWHHSRWNIFSLEYFCLLADYMAQDWAFGNASHLSELLGEQNSSYAPYALVEVSASNCEDV